MRDKDFNFAFLNEKYAAVIFFTIVRDNLLWVCSLFRDQGTYFLIEALAEIIMKHRSVCEDNFISF